MNSDRDTRCRVGCPIRRPRDHRSLASPPGFSQRATSFIASQCQGIHQMPFFACSPVSPTEETAPPPRTGSNPVPTNLSPPNLSLQKQEAGSGDGVPAQSLSLRKQGRGPIPAASHEDTSLGHPRQPCRHPPRGEGSPPQEGATQRRPGGVRLGHNNSLFTRQSTPRRGHPQRDFWLRRAARPAGVCRRVVEVNGFEPMTSCLQSRRSPS
jgi:hypothetical protein